MRRDAMVKIEMSKRLDFMLRALHESFSVLLFKKVYKVTGGKIGFNSGNFYSFQFQDKIVMCQAN